MKKQFSYPFFGLLVGCLLSLPSCSAPTEEKVACAKTQIVEYMADLPQGEFETEIPVDVSGFASYLLNEVTSGQLVAYDYARQPLTIEEVEYMMAHNDSVDIPSSIPNIDTTVVFPVELDISTVQRFRFNEEWCFDENNKLLERRITELAPVIEIFDTHTGDLRGYSAMFWVNWSDINPSK